MKYIIILLLISSTATAQTTLPENWHYKDSTITLQLPRCFSWWVTKVISQTITKQNYRMLSVLRPYVGDSTKPDSLFTVSLPAKYVQDGLELILTTRTGLGITDYVKIIYNQKIGATGAAIPNFTALRNQIATKANGNSNEKQVAIFLRDWFVAREGTMDKLYKEERDDVIELTKQ